ncbi:HpcH/HpaI aldolase family protein [Jannaschia sp. LMIT008]|uniref:HpcH/HpaI aldolase family protein n=1 Tax=Jannaschia maritima TaxID=3032585 RepID=UPI002810A5C2|nr:aldolase/citrate lyase family protein [Jannaschia sp. LMIT008]
MNVLAERLARGDVLRGLWQVLPGAVAAEVAAEAGFDWLVLDGEHGPWDPSGIRERLIASRAGGCPAIVRVPCGEDWVLKQALDLGADGVLVPMVHDAATARGIVSACRYPPAGTRGNGAAVTRASGFGRDRDHAERANRNLSIWVQAESRKALETLEDICAVDGVDCVFLGPADLAGDMGAAPSDPAVIAACRDAIGRIRAAGVAAGIFAAEPEVWVEAGANVVAMGADAVLLRQALAGAPRR